MSSKPNTRLGSYAGRTGQGLAWAFDYALPLASIRLYRLIPARGFLFGGPAASLATMAAIKAQGGGGWQAISKIAVSNHPPRPTS